MRLEAEMALKTEYRDAARRARSLTLKREQGFIEAQVNPRA